MNSKNIKNKNSLHYDEAYKNIFSSKKSIRDFLKQFVHENWIKLLDFETLEKVNSSYVTEELRSREDDIVWRIQMNTNEANDHKSKNQNKKRWIYVYVLLEFQRKNDKYMAIRMMSYIALLYQDLIKSKAIKGQKLPIVFPVVIYHGDKKWTAALNIDELIEASPEGLIDYRPKASYFLLDERQVPEEELQDINNVVSGIIRLEKSSDLEELSENTRRIIKCLKAEKNNQLLDAIVMWFNYVLIPSMNLLDKDAPNFEMLETLEEVSEMLNINMEKWGGKYRLEGLQQGREEGLEEGRERQTQLLRQMLIYKFGSLTQTVEEQIQEADLNQIETWFKRLLDASDLNSVFKLN